LADSVFWASPSRRNRQRRASLRAPRQLEFELGCYLVDSAEITALNEQHLGHLGSTDVISFDYGAPPGTRGETPWLCGEVFVCLDVARLQARQYRTTWMSELVRYLIHGLLHIRGYDDLTASARRMMKREENRLVRQLNAQFRFRRLRGIAGHR
jgi:probable rRNA maturation factor